MVMQTCLMRISIHTSAREVTAVWVYQVRNGCEFQSTLPQGKWQWQQSWRSTSVPFQSTLPQGKWQIFDFLSQIVKYISIHTSAREVTQHKTKVQNIFSHFNPHFRKGSDGQDIDWTATEDDISIHTSAREVTAKVRVRIMPKPISIHTSAREVTCSLDHWMHRKPYFNPHFRKGSDRMEHWLVSRYRISIHTSAREVTHQHQASHLLGRFQSTLPQGKWLPDYAEEQGNSSFQSTLPQGKWRDINNILCIL